MMMTMMMSWNFAKWMCVRVSFPRPPRFGNLPFLLGSVRRPSSGLFVSVIKRYRLVRPVFHISCRLRSGTHTAIQAACIMRIETPAGENSGLLSGSDVRRDDIPTGPNDIMSHSNLPGGGGITEAGNSSSRSVLGAVLGGITEAGNSSSRSLLGAVLGSIGTVAVIVAFVSYGNSGHDTSTSSLLRASQTNLLGGDSSPLPVLGSHHHHHKKLQEEEENSKGDGEENGANAAYAMPNQRCEWVVDLFTEKYKGRDEKELKTQYAIQSADSNVFYRATANIFWIDFVKNGWHERIKFDTIGIKARQFDGTPLQPRSTWTWVTGDQHLSNFGAWRNRGGEVVFSVNDFDEAAIYDFQVDVLRIAVSVCSHAFTNGLDPKDIHDVLRAFTDMYVETLINYVGSDRELLYELTPRTASGSLNTFLTNLRDDKSGSQMLQKFTEKDKNGVRSFIYGDKTHLVKVSAGVEQAIRDQFTRNNFGATMMHMGWHIKNWDDDFFTVLDVAARIGSGVGSYGVDRYYVLLKGEDDLARGDEVEGDGTAIILDVKFEPSGAVANVLTEEEKAWYDIMFAHDAERAVVAQRRLTSYVDPYTGWITLDGQAFVVRQRSPWKSAPDLNALTDPDEFIDFMEQVAVATATSHARGTESKSPGQFKHVIASALGHWADRTAWGKAVASAAMHYREQVLLDWQCFKEFVDREYPKDS